MNLDFSEEQIMLRSMARDFLADKFPKKLVKELEDSEAGYSQDIWKEMVGLGWMGLALPEKYGGEGMTYLDLTVLLEEMGRACIPGPYFSTVVLGALPILNLGNEEQKQKYLPEIATGRSIITLALYEENGRYDAAGITVKAVKDGNGYAISGTKLFVPDAHIADYLICVARTGDGANPEEGITIFITDAKAQGVKITPLKTISKEKLCEVSFNNVKVSGDDVLSEPDKGWIGVEKIVQAAATAKTCDMVGSFHQVFEMTLQYAKDRVAFGQPIGSFQAIQHHCANMAMDVNGAMLAAMQAAWKVDEGLPCAWEVAVAKAWASQVAPRVIALAHQIHGAIGTTMDHDLHYYTRRCKAAEAAFGDVDYYQGIVSEQIRKEAGISA
ncbi:acyl-CoA dehydrogenase family protein [Chloroflexota bacterium]